MIGTLVLYGLAFVGLCAIVGSVGVAVFTWRLPERTDPGVIDEQRHEFEHAQWRNYVRPMRVGYVALEPTPGTATSPGPWVATTPVSHTLDVPCACGGDHNPASAS